MYVRDPADTLTREALRKLFQTKVADPDSGIDRVYEAADIKEVGGDPEAFLALEASPGYQMGGGYGGTYVGPSTYHATHGYDPRRPEMRASLLLYGPNVRHGTIQGARLVDIAPTIAEWLGLSLPNVDGKPLQVTPAH